MTTENLQQLIADLAQESRREAAETSGKFDETGQYLREIGRQLGALGEKIGGPTEGMAFPSMRELLEERFQMNVVAPRVRARRNGRSLEVDVLAYSNAQVNEVYVVEVKSHLREDGLEQMKKILREFRDFFPEHKDKKIYGILAAVDAPEDVQERVLREGIYLARIHDEEFELDVPKDFEPRAY
ncbi:MAG TPA: DUF3782 domain-containing protein [Thermoanaerobaculia bacterium]|jgi:hypothetical protein